MQYFRHKNYLSASRLLLHWPTLGKLNMFKMASFFIHTDLKSSLLAPSTMLCYFATLSCVRMIRCLHTFQQDSAPAHRAVHAHCAVHVRRSSYCSMKLRSSCRRSNVLQIARLTMVYNYTYLLLRRMAAKHTNTNKKIQ